MAKLFDELSVNFSEFICGNIVFLRKFNNKTQNL